MWKNKMIEQVFNYADSTVKEMTDFFEHSVKNLEPKEDKNKSSAAVKKTQHEKPHEEQTRRLQRKCHRGQ